MRHEPAEFGLANAAARVRRTAPTAKPARVAAVATAGAPTAAIIDEAFARFDEPNVRPASNSTAGGNRRPLNQELVANLAVQLDALDRQREQLARLLRSIDADSIAD